jgi:hypothetical protein
LARLHAEAGLAYQPRHQLLAVAQPPAAEIAAVELQQVKTKPKV